MVLHFLLVLPVQLEWVHKPVLLEYSDKINFGFY